MSEPFFRTLVTYEVLTHREAFNGDAEQLAAQIQDGSASATLVDRPDPEEISPTVYRRLVALHDAAGIGYDVTDVPSPRLDVLAEVLLEMDHADENATWVVTAEDYKADIVQRFTAQGTPVNCLCDAVMPCPLHG